MLWPLQSVGAEEEESRVELVERMVGFIRDHKELYHQFDIGLCLYHADGGHALVQGKVELIPELDEAPPEVTLDYGHTILTRFHLPLEGFQKTFSDALLGGQIRHPQLGPITYQGDLEAPVGRPFSSYRKESGRSFNYVSSPWPYYTTQVRLTKPPPRLDDALVRPGLPMYPNWHTASHSFLGIGDAATDASGANGLFVLVPDPRARIERLVLEGETLKVVPGEGAFAHRDLLLKLYASRDELEKDAELPLDVPEIHHRFPFEPEFVSVHIITKESGEDLDFRDFRLSWGHLPASVKVKRTDDELTELLRRGEGPNIEYTVMQPGAPKFPQKVARTVSAFANTDGGVLFLGVNDEGIPVQSVDLSESNRIRDILHSHVDPPLEGLEFQPVEVDGVTILAVLVEEGSKKPYVAREQGTFVRHGATTKQATRSEIIELVKSSGSPYGFR